MGGMPSNGSILATSHLLLKQDRNTQPLQPENTARRCAAFAVSAFFFHFWGQMEHTVEKSCWSITLWAVFVVVGLVGLATLVANPPHVETSSAGATTKSRVANSDAATKISQ
ncbi:hypothetical protein [Ahrensia sp. R2A130]|uniref:hypothetical protein n=1 Tax=Ahrensia sp. R2A130 TaxID=744979 RepID=UPI00058DD1D8|nr:hypothetical protein [Ahrensia sp. R2A130]